jgi:DNA-binding PadR family transcriptional regulator
MLLLGALRFMQPTHGYELRRELLSWQLQDWANVKPGSIYSALRTMEKDGLIAVTQPDPAGPEPAGASPERTTYVMTPEGDKEFDVLLRQAWWQVERPTEPLMPALALMVFMSRAELLAAMQSRVTQLEGNLAEFRLQRATIQDGATGENGSVPEHVRELMDFALARMRGELDWSRTFIRRLRDGSYRFLDELKSVDS